MYTYRDPGNIRLGLPQILTTVLRTCLMILFGVSRERLHSCFHLPTGPATTTWPPPRVPTLSSERTSMLLRTSFISRSFKQVLFFSFHSKLVFFYYFNFNVCFCLFFGTFLLIHEEMKNCHLKNWFRTSFFHLYLPKDHFINFSGRNNICHMFLKSCAT